MTFQTPIASIIIIGNGASMGPGAGLIGVLEIVERDEDQDGFEVLPRRWVVERTFAWLGRYRRLSKDYERTIRSSEGMIYLASIHTMTKRLAPDG